MSSILINFSRTKDGIYIGNQEEAKTALSTIQNTFSKNGAFRSGHLHIVIQDNNVQLQRKSWFQRWREGSAATKENDEKTAAFVRCLMERAYGESGGSTPSDSSRSSRPSMAERISMAPSRSVTVMPQYRLASYLTRTHNRVGIQSLLNLLKHVEKDTDIEEIQRAGDGSPEDSLRAFFQTRGMIVSEPEKGAPNRIGNNAFRTRRWEIRLDRPQGSSKKFFSFANEIISQSTLEEKINNNELTIVEVKKDNSSLLYSVPRGKAQEFLDQHSGKTFTFTLIGSLSRITLPEATSPRPSLFKSGSADTLSTASITDESSPRSSSPSLSSRPSTVRASTSRSSLWSRASSFLGSRSSSPSALNRAAVVFEGTIDQNDVTFKKVADTTNSPDSGE